MDSFDVARTAFFNSAHYIFVYDTKHCIYLCCTGLPSDLQFWNFFTRKKYGVIVGVIFVSNMIKMIEIRHWAMFENVKILFDIGLYLSM